MCLTCSVVIAELVPLLTSGIIEDSYSVGDKVISRKNHILNHLRLLIGIAIIDNKTHRYEREAKK